MVMYDALKKAKRRRKYERYKLRHPSHLAITGHRWKGAVDDDRVLTGFCVVCGLRRDLKSIKYLQSVEG